MEHLREVYISLHNKLHVSVKRGINMFGEQRIDLHTSKKHTIAALSNLTQLLDTFC